MSYYKFENGKYHPCEKAEAEYVLIPINEYNGYQNAIRIVRDRALQQVDKSKADEHGYTFIKAEKRRYNSEKEKVNEEAWLITKSTPYALKMGADEAIYMIKKDLREFYNYVDLPELPTEFSKVRLPLSIKDFLCYNRRFILGGEAREPYRENTVMMTVLDWMDEYNGKMIFDIIKYGRNLSTGFFEVTYWATAEI